jgi:DNA-binding transcriptional MerR regulator
MSDAFQGEVLEFESTEQAPPSINRSFFKFQELVEQVGVKPYVLRFWESEFEQVRPVISETGQKYYTPKDIIVIQKIKQLLVTQKLSMQKAKIEIDKLFPVEWNYQSIETDKNKAPKKNKSIEIIKESSTEQFNIKPASLESINLSNEFNSKKQTNTVLEESEKPLEEQEIVEETITEGPHELSTGVEEEIAKIKEKLESILSVIREEKQNIGGQASTEANNTIVQ